MSNVWIIDLSGIETTVGAIRDATVIICTLPCFLVGECGPRLGEYIRTVQYKYIKST